MELGELDEPDVTLTTDYDTAKAMIVDQDPAVGDAVVHDRQDQGPGRHDEADGDADRDPADEVSDKIAAEIKAITA